jgi:hypothetical protein
MENNNIGAKRQPSFETELPLKANKHHITDEESKQEASKRRLERLLERKRLQKELEECGFDEDEAWEATLEAEDEL